MISKILILLCTICVCTASEQNPLAISSQVYQRGDVPLSYEYKTIHDYSPSRRQQAQNYYQHDSLTQYLPIQYAPLQEKITSAPPYRTEGLKADNSVTRTSQHTSQDTTYSSENKAHKDHLEPQYIEGDNTERKQEPRSFLFGHNVQVLKPKSPSYLDPYIVYHEEKSLENNPAQVSNFVYNEKPSQLLTVPKDINKASVESAPNNRAYGYVSKDYTPAPAAQIALHNGQSVETPSRYRHMPRLHLNIARIYGIANELQNANRHNIPPLKPALLTEAYIVPNNSQKTRLYLIAGVNKNNLNKNPSDMS